MAIKQPYRRDFKHLSYYEPQKCSPTMKDTDLISMIRNVEEIHEYIGNVKEMDVFLQKVADIKNFLSRFDSLEVLINHMKVLERQAYMLKDYFTVEEAALYLGMSKSQIYKMTSQKEITVYKPHGKNVYMKREEINEWIGRSKIISSYDLIYEAEKNSREWAELNAKSNNKRNK